MRWSLVCVLGFSLAVPDRAAADVDSYCVYSLEWLVDASQSVQLVTVVRGDDPGTGGPTARVKRVERVLKAAGETPEPAAADLSAAVRAAGEHRVLLFLRPAPKKPTPEVLSVIPLDTWRVPVNPAERAAAFRGAIPEGFGRPRMTGSERCVAIDRTGRVLVDPNEVIRVIERRAREHPKRVTDAGFLAPRGEELEDQNSIYFVLAPFDPDEREVFLKQLRSPSGIDRATAAGCLAHYPDAAVIAALKDCLTDDYHNAQLVADGPGGQPRTAEVYVVRRAAYGSLRKLNVDVPKPALESRR
jgi:hypothetical protein